MWILFSLACMVVLTAADIVGKKAIGADALAPMKLRITVMSASFVISILMYTLGVGESGLAPWTLSAKHPIILAVACCAVASEFLYMFSLRYVGMSIMEAVSGFEGVTICAGMIIINLAFGKLSAVKDMLTPAKLLLICVILVFTFLLPNIETMANRQSAAAEQIREKRSIIIGLVFVLAAVILASGNSLITDTVLDERKIGVVDFTMTTYFLSIIPLPAFLAALFKKGAKSQFMVTNRFSILYSILFTTQLFFGMVAVSSDAVRSEIMFLFYPVISIIGAKIFLKEKYTWRQNICMWIITLAAIGFCVVDTFL